MPEHPLLTGQWRNLLLLNFAFPHETIERLAPPSTEPDFHDGHAYISIVGFRFQNTRLFGIPFPGHTTFPEINLRFYVRREVGNELRRGVVFVREISPRRAVAFVANRFYNENYVTRPMWTGNRIAGADLAPGDTIEYAWQSHIRLPCREGPGEGSPECHSNQYWNRLAARIAAPLVPPQRDSLEEFLIEHYWGYSRGHDGHTREYRVAHVPWRIAPVDNVVWNCNVAATYDGPLAEFLNSPPTNAFVADGSPVQVFTGRKV